MIEFGFFTFADLAVAVSPRERIRDIADYGAPPRNGPRAPIK